MTVNFTSKPNTETVRWEITVWEKAEHWSFYTHLLACDVEEAWRKARKEYSKREYIVKDVRRAP